MYNRFSWIGAAFAAGLVATGCGSGDDNGLSSNDASPSETGAQGDSATGLEAATSDAPFASDATSPSEAGSDAPSSSETGSDATTSGASTCRPTFASGVNVAWINFASDVPIQAGELAALDTLFANVAAAGGRVVRWWFHTNGTVTPGYDTNGMANMISNTTNIADVKMILDHAHAAGIGINMSLWSFDMLQTVGSETGLTQQVVTNNTNLLTVDANRQAYIDNYLTPLATALVNYPGLYSWEIFNEAEGMTTTFNGWTPNKIDEMYVQKTVNWFSAAIHTADPAALVTTAAWTFQANATVSGFTDAYSDTALIAAGGKSNGTLNFYEVHYYDNYAGSDAVSPFLAGHTSAYWALPDTKPIVIGEFYAIETDNGILAANLYTSLFSSGYSGAWAWQYESDDGLSDGGMTNTKWPAMQVPMQNLAAAEPAAVACP
jgi:hypothetical protein